MQKSVSVWLLPTKKDKKVWGGLIDVLARKYHSPRFQPHITLYATKITDDQIENFRRILVDINKNIVPLTLEVAQVSQEENFFKSLYVEFELNKELNKLCIKLEKFFKRFGVYKFKPHLSLLYKENMAIQLKRNIKQKLSIPEVIILDRLGMVIHKNEADRMDVEGWKVINL